MEPKDIALYAACVLSFLASAYSAAYSSYPAALLASLAALCAAAAYRAWPFIEGFVFMHSNAVQLAGPYSISGARDVAVSRRGGAFVATAVSVLVPSSASSVDAQKLEEIIAQAGFPFKMSLLVRQVDARRLVEDAETRRAKLEISLSNAYGSRPSGSNRIEAIKRDIAILSDEIAQAKGGGVPLETVAYIAVSASSESRYAASSAARARRDELAAKFASAFSFRPMAASGEALADLVLLDSSMVSA